jgi:hypothetical protein
VTLDHFYSTMLSPSSIHKPNALIGYLCLYTLDLGFYGWIELFRHAVLSLLQVFHLYDVEFWLMLSVESIGLPSIVMCGDRGEVRCCGLSMG